MSDMNEVSAIPSSVHLYYLIMGTKQLILDHESGFYSIFRQLVAVVYA